MSRMIAANEFGTLTLDLANWPKIITYKHQKVVKEVSRGLLSEATLMLKLVKEQKR